MSYSTESHINQKSYATKSRTNEMTFDEMLCTHYSDNLKLNNELHDLKITVMIVCNRPSLMSFTHTQFLMEALCTQRMVTTPIFTIHDRESVLEALKHVLFVCVEA